MNLKVLPQAFTVCQVSDLSNIDFSREFVFLSRTDEELSLVCETESVPANTLSREDGWRGFRVAGQMDFGLTGVMAGLSTTLAQAGISIFAVSTFDTDYILMKAEKLAPAIEALEAGGYIVERAAV